MTAIGWAHPHLPNQGKTNEWYTPPHVFEALGVEFDLDPCAPVGGVPWLPARRSLSIEDDGLSQPWHGCVWLNPPYGREAAAWVERLAEHGDGVALVFARTDVRWWHSVLPRSSAVCFIEGRLTFIAGAGQSAPGNSGGPSALVAFGARCAEALQGSRLGLTYLTPVEQASIRMQEHPEPCRLFETQRTGRQRVNAPAPDNQGDGLDVE